MSYVSYKAKLKKINLKPDGTKEIVLETASLLKGQLETLSDMIGTKLEVTHDDQLVTYAVEINTKTNKPIREYKVDEKGLVTEVKEPGQQCELELEGVLAEKIETKSDEKEIDKEIIDDFIAAGMSPRFDDMPYDFCELVKRLREGETYVKFANELNMSAIEVSAMFDEYRKRVAEMAIKWDDWRNGKIKGEPSVQHPEEPTQSEEGEAPDSQVEAGGVDPAPPSEEISFESDNQPSDQTSGDGSGRKSDVTDPKGEKDITAADIDTEVLEAYILEHKPQFDGVEFDFPELLRQRTEDKKTWMIIAKSLNISSGKFSAMWKTYKNLVAKKMKEDGAA